VGPGRHFGHRGIGHFLYGLVGPFAAALMMSVGVRRVMMFGLTLMGASALVSQYMTQSWQFTATWGVVSGLGTGMVASVLGATITNRWFARNQGLVMGIFAASTATGSLIFLPFLAWLTQAGRGWALCARWGLPVWHWCLWWPCSCPKARPARAWADWVKNRA
jgi:MFS family permease